nr:S1 family peptidase [Kutzneria sp. CA-103260]
MTTAPAVAAPDLLTAMQHDFGLTAQQARTRVQQEELALRTAPTAQQAAGAAYAGSWFDPASGRLTVALTDHSTDAAVTTTGAQVVRATHSWAELAATKDKLDAGPAPAGVASWGIDPRRNSVVITVSRSDASVQRYVAAAAKLGPVVVQQNTHAVPQTFSAGTVGGDPYYINGNVRCSIGFSVQGGFVSAGHCGTPGSTVVGWDGSYMGYFVGSTFPGNDYSFIHTENGWWNAPVVLGWGTVSDALVRGSWEAPPGTSVCRSGSTTHWHCGTVQTQNQTVNYAQGAVYGLTGTDVCAEPGDSGGSFITGDQAQGVTSGGWGDCTSGGQTWFQPVNPILAQFGLSLATSA